MSRVAMTPIVPNLHNPQQTASIWGYIGFSTITYEFTDQHSFVAFAVNWTRTYFELSNVVIEKNYIEEVSMLEEMDHANL